MKILLIARNIVNIDDVDEFLKTLSKDIEQQEIRSWIFKNLRTYIKNDYEKVTKVTKFKKSDPDWLKKGVEEGTALKANLKDREFISTINHILDYFKSNKELLPKIKNVDFKEAINKSKDWVKELHKDASLIPDESGESIVRKYSNGVTWKRLLKAEALATEGIRMDHCVGGEEFQEKLIKGKNIIYSLRDKSNHPQCTIEVEKNKVKQIKGYNDGPVEVEFVKYVKNFLEKPFFKPYVWINPEDKPNIGLMEINGKEYDLYNLPKNLIIDDDLDLSNTNIKKLPDNLTINGNLWLGSDSKIKNLPKNLTVDKELNLSFTEITKLPDDLTVNGELNLSNSKITKFPENISINSSLNLHGTDIKKLPDNLTINDHLDISNTKITKLPKNLIVYGDLVAYNTKIGNFPDDLIVFGSLNLFNTNIYKLPDNLTIDGDLNLTNSKISELPEDLLVKGSLSLDGTLVTELPETLEANIIVLSKNNTWKKIPSRLKEKIHWI